MKAKMTPERKEKLNKWLFRITMAIIIGACVVVGGIRGCKSINTNMEDIDAFNVLLTQEVRVKDILSERAITEQDGTELIQVCASAGLDIFNPDGSISSNKWNNMTLSTSLALTDRQLGALITKYYGNTNLKELTLTKNDDNTYTLYTVNYIRLKQLAGSNAHLAQLLPTSAYISTTNTLSIDSAGNVTLGTDGSVRYNNLNASKSAVITATLTTNDIDILSHTYTNTIEPLIKQLSTRTSTTLTLATNNFTFNI